MLWNNLSVFLKNKPILEAFKAALKTKRDIIDIITFNGMQGSNKDILNYLYLSEDRDLI